MTVGFDFGTTNSLVSVVQRGRVVDVVDDGGRPYPSVVRYEGEEVLVGRDARRHLDDVGVGVHGSIVRSPKFLLGKQAVNVGGVEMSPIDIVKDIVAHVRQESLASSQRDVLGNLDHAVVTIPVTMNGPRRADLREAFARAGVTVAQFVHEPLAALYGYLRGVADPDAALRKIAGRYVLVVDWGGGTLDLTLCKIGPGQIIQLRNGGTDEIGGDRFDAVIRDEVVTRFRQREIPAATDEPSTGARSQLLQRVERAKIDLSARSEVTVYAPRFFSESGVTLNYKLSRDELDEITKPLVLAGIRQIDALLDSISMAPAEVSMCLVVGGMAAMPSIQSRLHEMFGPARVVVPEASATLVSQGAAWIAHDSQRLVLAKQVELELARGSRMTALRAGTRMPGNGQEQRVDESLFCSDPSNGTAKLPIVQPTSLTDQPQASAPRTTLGVLSIQVDKTAPPLVERLTVEFVIDEDLILAVTASSHGTMQRAVRDTTTEYFHDLEFGIGFPGLGEAQAQTPNRSGRDRRPRGRGLVLIANVTAHRDYSTVPGDVLYRHKSGAFARLARSEERATEQQILEHLYYQPCAVCRRAWGDPECRCGSGSKDSSFRT